MVLFHFIQGIQILASLFVIVGQNVSYHHLSDFETLIIALQIDFLFYLTFWSSLWLKSDSVSHQ